MLTWFTISTAADIKRENPVKCQWVISFSEILKLREPQEGPDDQLQLFKKIQINLFRLSDRLHQKMIAFEVKFFLERVPWLLLNGIDNPANTEPASQTQNTDI